MDTSHGFTEKAAVEVTVEVRTGVCWMGGYSSGHENRGDSQVEMQSAAWQPQTVMAPPAEVKIPAGQKSRDRPPSPISSATPFLFQIFIRISLLVRVSLVYRNLPPLCKCTLESLFQSLLDMYHLHPPQIPRKVP